MPLDFEILPPRGWINDPVRCQRAGVPQETVFQTKWEIALAMVDRVRTWGLADQVVGADAGYGKVCKFRDGLKGRGLLYVVGVDETTGVWLPPTTVPLRSRRSNRGRAPTRYDYGEQEPPSVLQVAQNLPPDAWKTISWDQRRRGPLQSGFAAVRVHPSHSYHEGKPVRPLERLLIEWPEGQEKPEHYWLSTLPETTPLLDLVRQAKWRWHIEQDYQQLKDELGLDHFEGRSWIGWQSSRNDDPGCFWLSRPGTAPGCKKGASSEPLNLTLPTVKRMMQPLLATWTGGSNVCGCRVPRRKPSRAPFGSS